MKKKKKVSPYSTGEENRLLKTHGYNPKVLYLGKLCNRGHEFMDSGCSVRNRKYGYCYECSKVIQEIHREKRIRKQAEWREKNKEKIKDSAKRYREENREHISLYYREWYAANREQVIQRRKDAAMRRKYGKKTIHKGGKPR